MRRRGWPCRAHGQPADAGLTRAGSAPTESGLVVFGVEGSMHAASIAACLTPAGRVVQPAGGGLHPRDVGRGRRHVRRTGDRAGRVAHAPHLSLEVVRTLPEALDAGTAALCGLTHCVSDFREGVHRGGALGGCKPRAVARGLDQRRGHATQIRALSAAMQQGVIHAVSLSSLDSAGAPCVTGNPGADCPNGGPPPGWEHPTRAALHPCRGHKSSSARPWYCVRPPTRTRR